MNNNEIAVVGGGLVGALLAITLKKRGFNVEIFEKREDPRKQIVGEGRSINLALSERGLNALRKIGAADDLSKVGVKMHNRAIHDLQGNLNFQAYGLEGQHILSVNRIALNCYLLDEADKVGVKLNFNKPVKKVNFNKTSLLFEDKEEREFAKIFGSDGAFSIVRRSLMKTDRFDYSQEYLEHGYKELNIPACSKGEFQLEENALHIWPRQTFMLIALPNPDKSFTCTLFLPFEGPDSFENLKSKDEVTTFFKLNFPDAYELIENLEDTFFDNPTSSLITIKCRPWTYKDQIALVGDASHAMVPFYGQGMNSGFEDVAYLDSLIELGLDWDRIFKKYERKRRVNTDAVAKLAVFNFLEMRDKVGYPNFQKRKRVEKELHKYAPDEFVPVYSLVTFSNVPYTYALEQHVQQDKFFDYLFEDPLLRRQMDAGNWELLIEIWNEKFAKKVV